MAIISVLFVTVKGVILAICVEVEYICHVLPVVVLVVPRFQILLRMMLENVPPAKALEIIMKNVKFVMVKGK
jgi:hypothetical protein